MILRIMTTARENDRCGGLSHVGLTAFSYSQVLYSPDCAVRRRHRGPGIREIRLLTWPLIAQPSNSRTPLTNQNWPRPSDPLPQFSCTDQISMGWRIPPTYLVPQPSAEVVPDFEGVEIRNRSLVRRYVGDLAGEHVDVVTLRQRLERHRRKPNPLLSLWIHWMRRHHEA